MTTSPKKIYLNAAELQQTTSKLEKTVTKSIYFGLYDPFSNIILEVYTTHTYADWSLQQKPNVTSGISDQKIPDVPF